MVFNSLFGKKNEPQNTKKVISFLNQKGGVGKTTMCFNTAHAMAKKGFKVLCLDFDPQANLSLLFGVETSNHIHQLLVNSVRELKALHTSLLVSDVIVKTNSGVDLLPSGQELSGFELTMAAINGPRQLILNRFMEKSGLLDMYDFIFIDCPPTLGLIVVNAICSSQGVIVPFKPDDFSKKGLEHFYQMLSDIEDMGIVKAPEVLVHIPNLMDTRRKQEEADLHEIENLIESNFGAKKLINPFFNKAQIVKAQASGKSVFDYKSNEFSDVHNKFNEIADIIGNWNSGV